MASISRRDMIKMVGVATGIATLTACGPTPTPVPPTATPVPPTKPPAAPAATATPVPPPATATPVPPPPTATVRPGGWTVKYPPFTKVSPAKTFTHARSTGAAFKFITGDTVEKWSADRFSLEMTGVTFTPKFIYASTDEYKQKMNLAMAANDLPDFFSAYPFDLYGQLVENKMLKDVTELWEKNAPQEWKTLFNWRDGILWEPLRIKGRIYGYPLTKFVAQDEKLLWLRKDWLDAIGAKEPPKTLDEVYQYAKAFVEKKVAGTDRPTIGLGINKDLNTWNLSTDPIFGAYGVMPGYWKKMADGTFAAYSTMPESKEVLALLNKWYKEGILNKEFFTETTNNSQKLVSNGQCGMWFGPFWNPRGATIVDGIKNEQARGNTKVAFIFADLPTGPKGRGTKFTLPVQGAHCASVRVSDADWLLALKHAIWVYELSYPTKLWETKWHGFEGYNYSWTPDGCKQVVDMHPMGIPAAFGAPQVLFQIDEYNYHDMLKKKYDENPKQLDCYERALVENTFAPAAVEKWKACYEAYKVAIQVAEKYAIGTAYNGPPTPTMIKEQGNLNAMEQAAYIDIIVGNKPISYFDEFVKEWKARGGDKIAAEIAEAIAKR